MAMPSAARTISTGNSKLCTPRRSNQRWPSGMEMALEAKIATWAKAEASSAMMPPAKPLPNGPVAAWKAAAASTSTPPQPTSRAAFGTNAPSTSSTMAPMARISSG